MNETKPLAWQKDRGVMVIIIKYATILDRQASRKTIIERLLFMHIFHHRCLHADLLLPLKIESYLQSLKMKILPHLAVIHTAPDLY